ncbi:hypothetical protein, conserved [Leishmania tarentolae]|uniref:Rhodanese domain-containing protein n=1 Tax=Leishmania tarentolae TaxID=5689 RepID=A0A640KBJ7_LEITA|nr:hypothetical protein, conserved [Leishmania tarentolae]
MPRSPASAWSPSLLAFLLSFYLSHAALRTHHIITAEAIAAVPSPSRRALYMYTCVFSGVCTSAKFWRRRTVELLCTYRGTIFPVTNVLRHTTSLRDNAVPCSAAMPLPEFTHPFNVYEAQEVVRALQAGTESGVYLLDVREEFEVQAVRPLPHALVIYFRDFHGAIQMRESAFQRKYGVRKPHKNDRILVYALNQLRASSAGSYLHAHGYKFVVFLNAKLSEYLDSTQNKLDEDL